MQGYGEFLTFEHYAYTFIYAFSLRASKKTNAIAYIKSGAMGSSRPTGLSGAMGSSRPTQSSRIDHDAWSFAHFVIKYHADATSMDNGPR